MTHRGRGPLQTCELDWVNLHLLKRIMEGSRSNSGTFLYWDQAPVTMLSPKQQGKMGLGALRFFKFPAGKGSSGNGSGGGWEASLQKWIALEKFGCGRCKKLPLPHPFSPKNVASWFKLLGRKLSELLYIKDSSLSSIYIKFLQIKLNFIALGIIAIQFLLWFCRLQCFLPT